MFGRIISLYLIGFIPMLIALGYDAYEFLLSLEGDYDLNIILGGFPLSDLGHLLTQKFPNQYRDLVVFMADYDDSYWQFISSELLTQKTVILSSFIGLIWAIPVSIYLIFKLLRDRKLMNSIKNGEYQYNRD